MDVKPLVDFGVCRLDDESNTYAKGATYNVKRYHPICGQRHEFESGRVSVNLSAEVIIFPEPGEVPFFAACVRIPTTTDSRHIKHLHGAFTYYIYTEDLPILDPHRV